MTKIKRIASDIISEVDAITKDNSFKVWLNNESTSPTLNQFIAINNSFIFRENIKTNKSKKYLAFDIDKTKKYNLNKLFVVEGLNFNSHYKLFTLTNTHHKINLDDAIKFELSEIGDVIYTIVGEIQDIIENTVALNNINFKQITLCPSLTQEIEIINDEIKIKDYNDREAIWTYIENYCISKSFDVPNNFPGMIDSSITKLQNDAYSNLILPTRFDPNKKYLLDKISMVVESHLNTYNTYIRNIDTDPNAIIEILRISYNFVSDVNKLLTLIINICDLKPIILWQSISKYLALDNKFKDLPFGFSKTKASLSDYESVIKNARNKSFHQLFPFNKALKFEIEALEKVTVTIFSTFGNKKGNDMTYKDQDLYELLRRFTRVNEQLVSKSFWIKNESVMNAIYELIIKTSDAIKNTK